MKKVFLLASVVLGASVSMPSAAAVSITVKTALAPNAFGSPSYAGWVANAVQAMHDGTNTAGNSASPTYFKHQTNVARGETVVTNFPSWKGKADPATQFGAAYANELGNRMHFALRVDGGGSQIAISQLAFSASSSDPANVLGFGFAAGGYNYSSDYQGVLAGADNMLWTADDVFITSGPNTQLVDGIVGRGSGNALEGLCFGPCTTAQQQAAINAAAGFWPKNGATFTGIYTLGDGTGTGTFNIAAVPEPATWAMMIGGFGLVGAAARRSARTAQVQRVIA